MRGAPAATNELFTGEGLAGWLLAAPILRALAAELVLKAIAAKTTGAYQRGHDLLKLFDQLDQSAIGSIERRHRTSSHVPTLGSVRSILASHRDDFVDFRYLGERWKGQNPYGADLDSVLRVLIAVARELPPSWQAATHREP